MNIENSGQISALTTMESYYWDILRSGNVPFLYAHPGTAKTSIYKSIARKLSLEYFDVRLGSADETDLGFPTLGKTEDGAMVLMTAPPEWAHLANTSVKRGFKGALVVFEELNRCRKAIRDASLGPLLEKTIGYKFRFAPHVYMGSCGNIGEADNCDVEEFDDALNSRLIHVKHDINVPYWFENFAKDNVISEITSFLFTYDSFFIKKSGDEKPMANPRTWTFLSNYLKVRKSNAGYSIQNMIEDVLHKGSDFIGSVSASRFGQYLQEQTVVSAKDVLDNFKKVEPKIKEWSKDHNRAKISEIMSEISRVKMSEYTKEQLDNIALFFKYVEEDSIGAFFWDNIACFEANMKKHPKYGNIVTQYNEIIKKLSESLKVKKEDKK